jgi:glycosyltransferase involved in cell wall biosynthesis
MTTPQHTPAVLSVVIPVYNEPNLWKTLLDRVRAVRLDRVGLQIVIVEDGSTDSTRRQLQDFADSLPDPPTRPEPGQSTVKVIFHDRNRGKGAALRTGFEAAEGDIVVVQDADLEYDPADYPRLLAPILAGQADVVYGTRFPPGSGRKGYVSNYLANRLLTWFSNLTTGLKLSDMETCYKMIRRETLRQITLEQDRFGFEPEVTAALARQDVRIAEVAVSYRGRTKNEGKKIGFKDGLQAIRCILRYGRRSKRRASMVAVAEQTPDR